MQDKMPNMRKKMYGKNERFTFQKLDDIVDIPNLLDIQKEAYKQFLEEGISEVLKEISPISDYSGKAKLYLFEPNLETKPKYDKFECKRRGASYIIPLKVKARFVVEDTGESIDQEVYLGDIPLMTEEGSFVFNGIERVVVSQIVRSPSVYFSMDKDDLSTLHSQMIPTRGSWLELEQGANEIIKVIVNRESKITLGLFLKCFGFTADEILHMFGDNQYIKNVLDKEPQNTQEEALIELSKKMRPSEVPSADATRNYINLLFFSDQYYNLARVGRYKFNKKLSIANRIAGQVAFENIVHEDEVLVKSGEVISTEVAARIQDLGINEVWLNINGKKHLVRGNNQVKLSAVFPCDEKELGINELVYYPTLMQILKQNKTKEKRIQAIKENAKQLVVTTLTMDDILAMISYYLDLLAGFGQTDNIDHLSNRRIASVGELLGGAFRSGMLKLSATMKETLQGKELSDITPSQIVNPRPVNKAMRDFIASSQLSQLMDQVNPLSGLTQKRRISAVGPGGVKKERAPMEVRDINYTHYGRICAIESPEGQSIGLISTLTSYAKINEYGFLETPYRKVDKERGVVTDECVYCMADAEDSCYIAQAVEPLTEDKRFVNARVLCRYKNSIVEVPSTKVDLMDVSPKQFISAATSLIPFLNNNDTPRALMGANMQRQAVPVLRPEAPVVGTGMEAKIAHDCGAVVLAKNDGVVSFVSGKEIRVKTATGEDVYNLIKFAKTNDETCVNQKPAVKHGEKVKAGDLLADGYCTDHGELALGKNVLIGYMNWEGYKYEDAIIISER
ncbi:MAG: DNA-directed RNA polymerase subunit beta, partial [Christensenellales bacterium]